MLSGLDYHPHAHSHKRVPLGSAEDDPTLWRKVRRAMLAGYYYGAQQWKQPMHVVLFNYAMNNQST